ncbi:unnamed protein product, partial [Polarella glacialis]
SSASSSRPTWGEAGWSDSRGATWSSSDSGGWWHFSQSQEGAQSGSQDTWRCSASEPEGAGRGSSYDRGTPEAWPHAPRQSQMARG